MSSERRATPGALYNGVMATEEKSGDGVETAEERSEERVAALFAGMNEVIRAGEEMRRLRAEMIRLFASEGWTQDRLARLAGMSQPAVSKQVTRTADAVGIPGSGPGDPGQEDTPWLEGCLWGLAEEIARLVGDEAGCAGFTHTLTRGRKRFTEPNVDALRRLVEADLREHRAELGARHQEAYDRIARALDTRAAAGGGGAASPSARRALARQVQRVRLRQS